MDTFLSALAVAEALEPTVPVHLYRPQAAEKAVFSFLNHFAGRVMFAVKTNPEPAVLRHLWQLGVKQFDVASLAEVRLVRGLFPEAELFFMHTIKSREAIREAYFTHGVRHFSLDSTSELKKIRTETKEATDLHLHVRLAIPNNYAELSLSDKFGIALDEAPALLQQVREVAARVGVCFHVGSQCMHPDAYRIAMRMAASVMQQAGVKVDSIDVGGGFPSTYPGMEPPALQTYFDAIAEEYVRIKNDFGCELFAEPGRALVAESGSVLVRVEHRRGDQLYINDGTYGSLFDAGVPKFVFPTRLVRTNGDKASSQLQAFSFFGPTCDTMDYMEGPFYLPEDIQEGDYIEVGQLGAYGRSLVTAFNGFTAQEGMVVVQDAPLMTMYPKERQTQQPPASIAA